MPVLFSVAILALSCTSRSGYDETLDRAVDALQRNDMEQASKKVAAALDIDATRPRASYIQAVVFQQQRQFGSAESALRDAFSRADENSRSPYLSDLWALHGKLLNQQGDHAGALQSYAKAGTRSVAAPGVIGPMHAAPALALARQGGTAAAAAVLDRPVETRDCDCVLLGLLGHAYVALTTDDSSRALEYFERAERHAHCTRFDCERTAQQDRLAAIRAVLLAGNHDQASSDLLTACYAELW